MRRGTRKNWDKKLTLHPFYLFLCLFNVMEEEGGKRQKSDEINLFDNFLKAISQRFCTITTKNLQHLTKNKV